MAICILGNNEVNKLSQNNINTINFVTTSEGIKENISEQIKEEKTVQYLIISDTKLTCENEISKLTAEVFNRLRDTKGLKLKVTFWGNDLKIIATKKFEVGNIYGVYDMSGGAAVIPECLLSLAGWLCRIWK